MARMTPEERKKMVDEGHTEECIDYWRDVMLADSIQERWDHWPAPSCLTCDMRRATKDFNAGRI